MMIYAINQIPGRRPNPALLIDIVKKGPAWGETAGTRGVTKDCSHFIKLLTACNLSVYMG